MEKNAQERGRSVITESRMCNSDLLIGTALEKRMVGG